MLLGQIVAISFALNLFFLAIVLSSEHSLTDIKDARVGEQEKWNKEMIVNSGAGNPVMAFDYQVKQAVLHKGSMDQIWTPPRIFYTIPLLVTLVSVSLIPYSVHSRYFLPLLAVPHVLLFVPVMLYNVVPGSWGTVQPSHAYAKEQYVTIYRLIFWFSVCLYLKATVAALLDKNVDERDYPYLFTTLHHPRLGVRQRQHASRHQRYIGELFNHPAVGSVGWDVILCWLSAAMWVVIQGRSSWTELIKVMLPWKSSRSSNDETGKETSKDK